MIKRDLRILLISSHFYPKIDGTVRSIDTCIRALTERGNTVFLVTRRLPGTPLFEEYRGVKVFRVGPSSGRLFGRFLLGLNQALTAIKLLGNTRVDIIDSHGFSPLIAGLILKIVYHVPLILSFHGIPTLWARKFRRRTAYEHFLSYLIERFLIRKTDRIIVQSYIDAKRVTRLYGTNLAEKIEVIPRVVDTRVFTYKPAEKVGKPVILFVGNLSSVYGAELLIRATPIVLKEVPRARFIFVGNGPLKPHFEKLVSDLKIQKSVVFTGLIKDRKEVANFYRKSSVVIVPSRYVGGFPNVVVEALATGRPVITTLSLDRSLRSVGVFFVKKRDPKALAKAIKQVLSSKECLESTAKRRKFVEKHYSKEVYITKLEQIYIKLIHKNI